MAQTAHFERYSEWRTHEFHAPMILERLLEPGPVACKHSDQYEHSGRERQTVAMGTTFRGLKMFPRSKHSDKGGNFPIESVARNGERASA
jgi:hypothetical protein